MHQLPVGVPFNMCCLKLTREKIWSGGTILLQYQQYRTVLLKHLFQLMIFDLPLSLAATTLGGL